MIRDVMDLDVYRFSLDALKELYALIKKIPLSERDTIDQIKRAGKSVPANIAEGFAKRSSEKEFKRFLKIALGSSDEVITHLRVLYIAVERLRIPTKEVAGVYSILSKRLNRLHSVWRSGYF